jgi:hypothetical protein
LPGAVQGGFGEPESGGDGGDVNASGSGAPDSGKEAYDLLGEFGMEEGGVGVSTSRSSTDS